MNVSPYFSAGHRSMPGNVAALGISAKSAVKPGSVPVQLRGTVHDQDNQRGRWAMLKAAGRLLNDREETGDSVFRYRFRVPMCQRGLNRTDSAVEIRRNVDGTRAVYAGVQNCGSVWHCPICAPKIAADRREEIITAIKAHLDAGGEVSLVTLTRQHGAGDSGKGALVEALTEMRAALSRTKGLRAWREVKDAAGVIGSIRVFEITYGEQNGWHPHTHELIFHQKGADLSGWRKVWARELVRRGLAGLAPGDIGAARFGKLRALLTRCCDIQGGAAAADYISKFGREPANGWGLASEMTRSHLKQVRRSQHCSPWGLLADYVAGDGRSGDLWREYALAFHGKAQLFWSKGLKARFGLAELTDDELAEKPDAVCSQFVAFVSDDDWRLVLKLEARFDLLRAAAIDGPDGVRIYLSELRESARAGPPGESGAFAGLYRDRNRVDEREPVDVFAAAA